MEKNFNYYKIIGSLFAVLLYILYTSLSIYGVTFDALKILMVAGFLFSLVLNYVNNALKNLSPGFSLNIILNLVLISLVIHLFLFNSLFISHNYVKIENESTLGAILTGGFYNSSLTELFSRLLVKKDTYFIMDGGVDYWVYTLYEYGILIVPFNLISVEEKGIVYFYWLMLKLFNNYNILYLSIVNWFFHLISALFIYKCLFALTNNDKTSAAAAVIFLLTPENLYWNAILFKDGLVFFLIIFSLFISIQIFNKKNYMKELLYFFIIEIVLLNFRSSLALLPIIGLFLILLYKFLFKKIKLKKFIEGLIFIAVLVVLFEVFWGGSKIYSKVVSRTVDKVIVSSEIGLDKENLTYATSKKESLLLKYGGGDISYKNIYFIPIRIMTYLLTPTNFKNKNVNIINIINSLSTLIFYMLLPLFVRNIYLHCKGVGVYNQDSPILIYFIISAAAVCFAGPMLYLRYRVLFSPFYVMLSLSSLPNLNRFKMIFAAIVFALLWLFVNITYYIYR